MSPESRIAKVFQMRLEQKLESLVKVTSIEVIGQVAAILFPEIYDGPKVILPAIQRGRYKNGKDITAQKKPMSLSAIFVGSPSMISDIDSE